MDTTFIYFSIARHALNNSSTDKKLCKKMLDTFALAPARTPRLDRANVSPKRYGFE